MAPIARLLQVSLEELLSFQEELSREEIRSLLQQGEEKAEQLPFEDFFQRIKNQLHQYPNCETLLHGLTALTESQLIKKTSTIRSTTLFWNPPIKDCCTARIQLYH